MHRLINEFNESKLTPREDGRLVPSKPTVDIRVTEGSKTRACKIMSEILTRLEERGFTITCADGQKTMASRNGESIPFHLEENSNITYLKEYRKVKGFPWHSNREYTPTGHLSLIIDSYSGSLRRNFRDGRKQKVEKLIPEFVSVMEAFVEGKRKQRIENERWERHYEAVRRARELEEARLKALDEQIALIQKIESIKTYLTYVHASGSTGDQKREWVSWVERQVVLLQSLVGVPSAPHIYNRLTQDPTGQS